MAQKIKTQAFLLQTAVRKATRINFVFIAAYIFTTIAFDSWNLLTYQAVSQRWTVAGALLIINTVLWYIARMRFSSDNVYKVILLVLIVSGVVFASYNVFWERGMASKSVALFILPILTAAIMRSRSTLFATASLCVAGYSIATVRYFFLHYGEGFRVELYSTIGFYSALFFVVVGLLLIIIHPEKEHFLY